MLLAVVVMGVRKTLGQVERYIWQPAQVLELVAIRSSTSILKLNHVLESKC